MKRVLLVLGVILTALVMFSACGTQHKCAAYGHYSEVVTSVEQNNQL